MRAKMSPMPDKADNAPDRGPRTSVEIAQSSGRLRAAPPTLPVATSQGHGPGIAEGRLSIVDIVDVPVPDKEGYMSTAAKMSLADIALALREEQVEARIIHYKAELATSPELDAVTEAMVREFTAIQKAARGSSSMPAAAGDKGQLEIELIQNLKEMLSRIFRPGKLATFCERKLNEVAKRFARLFFESELHDKIRGAKGETKTMRFPSQALFHVLAKHEAEMNQSLEAFTYADPDVAQRAKEKLQLFVKEMRNDFLARTTPELNELLRHLTDVLTAFFIEELPSNVGELAWEVVKEGQLADGGGTSGYKIGRQLFGRFRQAFERRFLQRLVPYAEDEMLKRVRESSSQFREETIRLVADPFIFSETCEIICDAIYDMLYNEGFLDLPNDWRVKLQSGK